MSPHNTPENDHLPDLLMQLAGHFFGPQEPVEVRRSRWAGWLFCLIATLFLVLGLWQLAELYFGPVLAPLLTAAAAAFAAAIFMFYSSRKARRVQATKRPFGPLLQPKILLAAVELLLAPRSLRRTVFTGLILNAFNRKFFR